VSELDGQLALTLLVPRRTPNQLALPGQLPGQLSLFDNQDDDQDDPAAGAGA